MSAALTQLGPDSSARGVPTGQDWVRDKQGTCLGLRPPSSPPATECTIHSVTEASGWGHQMWQLHMQVAQLTLVLF